jgi:hypothetical protein
MTDPALAEHITKILMRIRSYYGGQDPPVYTKGSALFTAIRLSWMLYCLNPKEYENVLKPLIEQFTAAEGLLQLSL